MSNKKIVPEEQPHPLMTQRDRRVASSLLCEVAKMIEGPLGASSRSYVAEFLEGLAENLVRDYSGDGVSLLSRCIEEDCESETTGLFEAEPR